MEQEDKNSNKEIIYLQSKNSGEDEKQPQRKFLGWGCISKNNSVLIIA